MAELVRLNVDAIVAGSNQTVAVARRATGSIPIVMALAADPVGAGFVASLARPGGNVTGLSVDVSPDIAGKRLALLKEIVPTVSRVAVLWEPASPESSAYWQAAQRAAVPLQLGLASFEIRRPGDVDAALESVGRDGANGLSVFLSSLTLRHVSSVTAFALRRRIPAIYGNRAFAEGGGLISYGPDLTDSYRRTATYLDKIFRGSTPAQLPVEQPTRFELVLNLRTARALGLTIPPAVRARADVVIE